jgi:hypothetical protein
MAYGGPENPGRDEAWRQAPMSLLQWARLATLLGQEPPVGLTAGAASDLYVATLAERGMRCRS